MSLFNTIDKWHQQTGTKRPKGRWSAGRFLGYAGAAAMFATGNPAAGAATFGAVQARDRQKHQQREAESDRQFAKEQANLAHQRDKDFWKMQAQYNTPAEQMQRLKEAGLNPNLMYQMGSSGEMSGRVPQAPVPDAPIQTEYPDHTQSIDHYLGMKERSANLEQEQYRIQIERLRALVLTQDLRLIGQKADEADIHYKAFRRVIKGDPGILDHQIRKKMMYDIAEGVIKHNYGEWSKKGIQPSDHFAIRLLYETMKSFDMDKKDIGKWLKEKVDSLSIRNQLMQILKWED